MNRAEKRRQRKLAQKSVANAKQGKSKNGSPYQHSPEIQKILDLAVQSHNAGRLSEAESGYQKILEIDPSHPVALHRLGLIAAQVGKYDIAVELTRKALTIKPDYAEAHCSLGDAQKELGELEEAVTSYQNALVITPDNVNAHNNLGNVLKDQGKLEKAIASYRKAISLWPDHAGLHSNLGVALKDLGKLDEAAETFHKALAIKPDFAEAHRNLSAVKKYSEYDADIQAMEKEYAMPDIGANQSMHLAFGLGKAFEDLKQYEKAFDFLLAGNALKRKQYSYSIADQGRLFKKLKGAFDASLFTTHQDTGLEDNTPIFILGMPRSGTTLIEQILASHPQIHGAGELGVLDRIVSSIFDTQKNDLEYAQSIRNIDDDAFARLGAKYIYEVRKLSKTCRFITDKMPGNYLHIGIIKLALPNAKVIHCKRNPADNGLSLFKSYFPDMGHYFAYDLLEIGQFYKLYEDLMKHWHSVIPGFVHDIQYEDMVSDQVGQTQSLLEYCGLDWDDACLNFHKTTRQVNTASATQVRRPIYKSSVQSWKRYEKQLAPMLDILKA